jgi:hypothetical protein
MKTQIKQQIAGKTMTTELGETLAQELIVL